MRPLTFPGFLTKYVASLSEARTTAIYPLVREASSTNPRLREPLLLYAMAKGKTATLLTAARRTTLFPEYQRMCGQYQYAQVLADLQAQHPSLPEAYQKVWRSYQSVAGSAERDLRVKALMRDRITKLQKEKNLTTYRICKDLELNNANINSWLKHGENKVGIETARGVLDYVENC